jgi:4-amino-4-deoxy-L-arabinose transferase-like glycosyltransferase
MKQKLDSAGLTRLIPEMPYALFLIALAKILIHLIVNDQYGWHRDELATLDDARYLAWGYVAYPPLTPFIARIGLELFGPALVGIRFFAALAQSAVIILAGLMARELGGSRAAQLVSAVAVAICPVALMSAALFQYVSFDYLWWVLVAYLTLKLLKYEDPRWWLAIGAAIGLGLQTKYTIVFLAAGLAAGIFLTGSRRHLASPWLWGGAALSALIFLPNVLWQWQHGFISWDFLNSIHARDIRIGRTDGFLIQQLFVGANPAVIPFWIAGLYYYFFTPSGRRFRMLAWMFTVPLILFTVMKGRSYYLAPAYPMLIAAGAVMWQEWMQILSQRQAVLVMAVTCVFLSMGGTVGAALALPIGPVNSWLWNVRSKVQEDFAEEIGWQELVQTVAGIYSSLPESEKGQTGILTGNYGEAGAIDLYGPAYGLPKAISGINSYWLRGYGDPPPATLIILGFSKQQAEKYCDSCEVAGYATNRFGVRNEESIRHRDIFLCRRPHVQWQEFWKTFRWFG